MPTTIEAIREDLELCRRAKRKPKIFGAETHRFTLNPIVRNSEVSKFEVKHGIELPEGYRRFITELGNGGAGPYYGLFKFREMDDCYSSQRWKENDGFVGTLAKPFPHTKAWNDLPEYPGEDEIQDEDLHEAEVERIDRIYWNPEHVNGAIPICHQGCALRNWLVVTGPEAGNVWEDLRADEGGLVPAKRKRKSRMTFLEWYDDWLQQAVATLPKPKPRKSIPKP
ncbi:SMI1/KNR4 family protein [Novipirellula artificiosorum]|uniref:Knr4/Smi1-like domain-containing protein n=1 Tax=Novipirellula artificiosorum TaxID=2528016 RepID=A0A5C6CNN6_9BACT|nr:SMI1/KNR4 family protein [Novipirellula artificiosorum]TWU26140.1 hypothetical protein Poly41_70650 [Novipirellula artificiosorum]